MELPTFWTVVYQSPWFPTPPDGSLQGLTVTVRPPTNSALLLAVRLRQGQNTLVQNVSTAPGTIALTLLPTSPLSNSVGYFADAQWIASGQPDWTNPSLYVTAPVVTAIPVLIDAAVTAGNAGLRADWIFPESYVPPTGAYVSVFNTTPKVVQCGFASTAGRSGSLTFSTAVTAGAQVYLQAIVPINGTPGNGFTGPFSIGPFFAGNLVPVDTPVITASGYDGSTASVGWTPPATPATSSPITFDLIVASGDTSAINSVSLAGPGGGIAAIGDITSTGWTAAGRVRVGPVVGAVGATATVLTAVPSLHSITISGTTVTATATLPAGVPAGTGVHAWLMAGDVVVTEGDATAGTLVISLTSTGGAVAGLSLVVQARLAGGGGVAALTGPRSSRYTVLGAAPVFTGIAITPSGTNWSIAATWLPPATDTGINAYSLVLTQTGQTTPIVSASLGVATATTLTFAQSAITASNSYTLTLQASSPTASTPAATQAFYVSGALFKKVAAELRSISAYWIAPSHGSVERYQLRLLNLTTTPPQVVQVAETASLTATFNVGTLDLLAPGAYGLDIVQLNGLVSLQIPYDSTPKTQPAVFTGIAQALSVSTSPTSGIATLQWTSVSGANDYNIDYSDGRTAGNTSTNSYTLPSALEVGSNLSVTVTAYYTDGAVDVNTYGPASGALTIPTNAPKLLTADYDGVNVSASWEAVPGSLTYVLTILNGTTVVSSTTVTGTSARYTAALASNSGPYTLVVQAQTAEGTGLPSASLPLVTTAWFISTETPSTAQPHVFPAAAISQAASNINLFLPPLSASTITVATVGAFSLTANTDVNSSGALPYILQIASGSEAWTFAAGAAPIRTQLQTDYINFLQAAETAGAQPWGISILQQAISRWLPQSFAESLYYGYGLNGQGLGNGTIDLRPGMVLRVESANYTNVWSGGQPSWLNGFAGGPTLDFEIGDSRSSTGTWQVTMDTFIARLIAAGVMTVNPPGVVVSANQAAGVADAADMFFNGFVQPFYRLFIPNTLLNPSGTGSITPNANFALAAASSYLNLCAATSVPSNTSTVVYFRGRAALRVMIRVSCNDIEVLVPVGTTVGNLLDRYGVRPPASAMHLSGLSLVRGNGPTIPVLSDVTPPPAPLPVYNAAAMTRVRLDWGTAPNYGDGASPMDLPLLPGDRVSF